MALPIIRYPVSQIRSPYQGVYLLYSGKQNLPRNRGDHSILCNSFYSEADALDLPYALEAGEAITDYLTG
jgi:hypothetical protein